VGSGAHAENDVSAPGGPSRYPAIPPQSEDEMLAGLTDPGGDAATA
jgi:hypothetical protein